MRWYPQDFEGCDGAESLKEGEQVAGFGEGCRGWSDVEGHCKRFEQRAGWWRRHCGLAAAGLELAGDALRCRVVA